MSAGNTATETQAGSGGDAGHDLNSTQAGGGTTTGHEAQPIVQPRQQARIPVGEGEPDWNNLNYEEIKKLRGEHQSLRRRLSQFESQDTTEQGRLRGELEATQTRITEFESSLTTLQTENRLLRAQMALSRLGANHPELISHLLTEEDLVDDKAAKAAAERIKKDYPDLFRAQVRGSADGANEGQSAGRKSGGINQMIRTAAGRPS